MEGIHVQGAFEYHILSYLIFGYIACQKKEKVVVVAPPKLIMEKHSFVFLKS